MIDTDLLSQVNSAFSIMDDFKSDAKSYENAMLPSSINLTAKGLYSANALNFLFSPKVEIAINNILDIFLSGNYQSALDKTKALVDVFNKLGIGREIFKGQIGSTILKTISNTTVKVDLSKTKSKLKKVLALASSKKEILKNLKVEGAKIDDPIVKEKYDRAVDALKKIVKVIISIYKNRKKISNEIIGGLNTIMYENAYDVELELEKIEF